MTTSQKDSSAEPRTTAMGEAHVYRPNGGDGVTTENSPEMLLRNNLNLMEDILTKDNLRLAFSLSMRNEIERTVKQANRRIRIRTYGGVGGKARKGLPISIRKRKKSAGDQLENRQRCVTYFDTLPTYILFFRPT